MESQDCQKTIWSPYVNRHSISLGRLKLSYSTYGHTWPKIEEQQSALLAKKVLFLVHFLHLLHSIGLRTCSKWSKWSLKLTLFSQQQHRCLRFFLSVRTLDFLIFHWIPSRNKLCNWHEYSIPYTLGISLSKVSPYVLMSCNCNQQEKAEQNQIPFCIVQQ